MANKFFGFIRGAVASAVAAVTLFASVKIAPTVAAPPPDQGPVPLSVSTKASDLGGRLGITVPEAKKAPEIRPDQVSAPAALIRPEFVNGFASMVTTTPFYKDGDGTVKRTTHPSETAPDRIDLQTFYTLDDQVKAQNQWLNPRPSISQTPTIFNYNSNPTLGYNSYWKVTEPNQHQNFDFVFNNVLGVYKSALNQYIRVTNAATSPPPIVKAPTPQQVITQTIVQPPNQALSYDQKIAALKKAADAGRFGEEITACVTQVQGGLACVANYGSPAEQQSFQDIINAETNAVKAQAATILDNTTQPAITAAQATATATATATTTPQSTQNPPAQQKQGNKPIALLRTTFSVQRDLSLALEQTGLINQAAAQLMIAAMEEQGIDTSTIDKTALSIKRTLLINTPEGFFDTGLEFGDFRKAAQARTRQSETAARKATAPKPEAAAQPVPPKSPPTVSSAERKDNAAPPLQIEDTKKLTWNQSSLAVVEEQEPLQKTLALCLHKAGLPCDQATVENLRQQIEQQYSEVTGLAVDDGKLQVRGTKVSTQSNLAAASLSTSARSR